MRRALRFAQILRGRSRFRAWRFGAVTLLVGVSMSATPAYRNGTWVAMLPTLALVATEQIDPEPPASFRRELNGRFARDELRPWERVATMRAYVDDLRDDEVEWNAQRGIRRLQALGLPAVPAVEEALRSPDWQQRQLAAHVLRHIPKHKPDDALIRVTFEGLRSDDLPSDGRFYTPVYNASEGYWYLVRHARAAEPYLARGLDDEDDQMRRLCRAIVVQGRVASLYPRAIPVFIEQLRDNDVSGDASYARRILSSGDPAIVSWLRPLLDSDDEQQRRYAAMIMSYLNQRAGMRPER